RHASEGPELCVSGARAPADVATVGSRGAVVGATAAHLRPARRRGDGDATVVSTPGDHRHGSGRGVADGPGSRGRGTASRAATADGDAVARRSGVDPFAGCATYLRPSARPGARGRRGDAADAHSGGGGKRGAVT